MIAGIGVERYLALCEDLRGWFQRNNYQGSDPYFVDEKVFRYQGFPLIRHIRSLMKPLHPFIPQGVFSALSKPTYIPKALGLIIAGNASLYRCAGGDNNGYIEECEKLTGILELVKSDGFEHSCWGVPFEWGSNPRYPKNHPMAIATAQIGLALLDFYRICPTQRVLDLCSGIAHFFIEENGYWIEDEQLGFFYSSLDRHRMPNVNAYCLTFLARYDAVAGQDHSEPIAKVLNFVLRTQQEDGSWPYVIGDARVDSRHTGFTLSALCWAGELLQNRRIDLALEKGWRFYRENLFDGIVPKWNPSQAYPVDIHDVAQAIVTASTLGHLDFAQDVAGFALANLFDGKDEFYYKLFRNGRVNKTVFVRWGQAWMFRALSLLGEKMIKAQSHVALREVRPAGGPR